MPPKRRRVSKAKAVASTEKVELPADWQWVQDLINEAHLPHLGLPTRWEGTASRHSKIAWDPETRRQIDIESGTIIKQGGDLVGFIMATRMQHPMPGAAGPAAVRVERYGELTDFQVEDPHGNKLVPCIAHGDYVRVEALHADHMQAASEIIKRQQALVNKLNTESAFAEFVMRQEGMNKFFVKVGRRYYGTLFFYELYFNDIDNIWLVCEACNRKKNNQDTVAWFRDQWLYGEEFLDYLGRVRDDGILRKTQNKEGLAQVAIEWFWQRHANYISVARRLLTEVNTPVQLLNIKVDRVIGTGNTKRAERLAATLEAKLMLLRAVAQAPGLTMARTGSETPAESSGSEDYLKVDEEYNAKEYGIAAKRMANSFAEMAQDRMKEELRREKRSRRGPYQEQQSARRAGGY